MKITIESTDKIILVNGVPARIWEGTTESGIQVHCFVTRIAIDATDERANEQFMKELQECRPPSQDVAQAYDARLLL